MVSKTNALARKANDLDFLICLFFNRPVHRRPVQRFFAIVSRLGNGVFWYVLMFALPFLFGVGAAVTTLHMIVVGAVGLAIYRLLKRNVTRERPFVSHARIRLGTEPLDRYSFPSGHTLHAVAFTIIATAYIPLLAWVLVPFTLLVALSRMVLGLHYPSDVAVGAAIGTAISTGSLYGLELLAAV